MAVRVYHWKHGWIPLDHLAALSKAKGSEGGARRYLAGSHAAGHAHASVVEGEFGGGTHVRGLQPVAAGHLPRKAGIHVAFDPASRRFEILDPTPKRTGIGPDDVSHDLTAASIPEHLAEAIQRHGYRITNVKKSREGVPQHLLVEHPEHGLRGVRADGSNAHELAPEHIPAPTESGARAAAHDHRDDHTATHTVKQSSYPGKGVIVPVGGRLGGLDVINGNVSQHINDQGEKVIGYQRRIISTVDAAGTIRRYKADGSNLHKPVIAKTTAFKQQNIGGWTHSPANEVLAGNTSLSRRALPGAPSVSRAYTRGNKTVIIEPNVSQEQATALLHELDQALHATNAAHGGRHITFVVPKGDGAFRATRGGSTLGYVYRQKGTERVYLNPSMLRDYSPHGSDVGGHFMAAAGGVSQLRYTITHELGHINDLHNDHNFEHTHTHTPGGFELPILPKGESARFHREHVAELSKYGRSNPQEGYAEAFAQYHLGGPGSSPVADEYARRYGWQSSTPRMSTGQTPPTPRSTGLPPTGSQRPFGSPSAGTASSSSLSSRLEQHYRTGSGRALWATAANPEATLAAILSRTLSPEVAKRTAKRWAAGVS